MNWKILLYPIVCEIKSYFIKYTKSLIRGKMRL